VLFVGVDDEVAQDYTTVFFLFRFGRRVVSVAGLLLYLEGLFEFDGRLDFDFGFLVGARGLGVGFNFDLFAHVEYLLWLIKITLTVYEPNAHPQESPKVQTHLQPAANLLAAGRRKTKPQSPHKPPPLLQHLAIKHRLLAVQLHHLHLAASPSHPEAPCSLALSRVQSPRGQHKEERDFCEVGVYEFGFDVWESGCEDEDESAGFEARERIAGAGDATPELGQGDFEADE
jgi:hypothetical protein